VKHMFWNSQLFSAKGYNKAIKFVIGKLDLKS